MQPAQITFSVILGLNLLTALILGINTVFDKGTPNNKLFLEESPGIDNPYRFTNPKVAYEIWTLLDVFEGNDTKEVLGNSYNKKITGFEPNFNYCNEHRLYVVNNPEFVFESKNYFSNYWKTHKLRTQVIPAIGNDVYPGLFPAGKVKKEESKMRTDINLFYTYNLFYYFRKTGTQFSCISQASNHIPGHDKMYRKDKVGQALVDYAKGYADRPECFNYDKYFIKTWVLQKKDQCKAFFKEFNSQKYQDMKEERNVVYFRKIGAGVHEGKGVFPVNDKEENYIRTLYANGTKCGKVKQNNLIQYNVYNLLLLDNRKFGFRMFMLVASTNPVIAYYHDGYARLSLNEYDPNSGEKKTFVTNIGVNLKEATQGTFLQNMTNEQIQEYTFWTLEDVTDYLVKHKRVESHEWLENHLRPEFRKVMTHLIRMTQSGFYKKSSLFELYGLDFVMDVDLNLWFIEANSMPLVNGFTKRSTIMMNQMLKDAFDIVLSLAKSRIKRVIEYVNMLSQEVIGKNKVEVKNLEKRRQEYKELSKNYFEPEFMPRANNTFYKIIDENESGVKRFSNLIEEKCL